MYDLSIKVENYKCFKEETGFDRIHRVNLIIGRNNSGKSTLLDIIEVVSSNKYDFDQSTWRENTPPKIIFESQVEPKDIDASFDRTRSGGDILMNHHQFGQRFIGRQIKWSKSAANQNSFLWCEGGELQSYISHASRVVQNVDSHIPLQGNIFRRLLAERDITPEKSTKDNTIIPNGTGITNAIQQFINSSTLPNEIVQIDILDALNEIFSHDAIFHDIVCQQHENDNWEIYLEESIKGRIALSQSGSGLKTVISVLTYLYLIPSLENKPLKDYIFGFEELENNIHPALLRRLNAFIYQLSLKEGFIYFLTTHSNVLIDQFSKQEDAQIIHITHNDSVSICTTATTYIDNNGILDDLDVRASDLLQANGIIWVEGPSDRIYLNRWIELWSDGELKEGTHYQIVFYGGRLLSHLEATAPEEVEAGISILNANRNAIMMIDSDKRTRNTRLNDTKKRIRDEFNKIGAICWITKGKEIENYIPSVVVDEFFNVDSSDQVGQYLSFFDHLDTVKNNEGTKFSAKKPALAEKLIGHMTKENLVDVLDLESQLKSVCEEIRSWNS